MEQLFTWVCLYNTFQYIAHGFFRFKRAARLREAGKRGLGESSKLVASLGSTTRDEEDDGASPSKQYYTRQHPNHVDFDHLAYCRFWRQPRNFRHRFGWRDRRTGSRRKSWSWYRIENAHHGEQHAVDTAKGLLFDVYLIVFAQK